MPQFARNLGRVTNALALIIQDQMSEADRNQPIWKPRVAALREVSGSYWDLFDDSVRQFLVGKDLQPEK